MKEIEAAMSKGKIKTIDYDLAMNTKEGNAAKYALKTAAYGGAVGFASMSVLGLREMGKNLHLLDGKRIVNSKLFEGVFATGVLGGALAFGVGLVALFGTIGWGEHNERKEEVQQKYRNDFRQEYSRLLEENKKIEAQINEL